MSFSEHVCARETSRTGNMKSGKNGFSSVALKPVLKLTHTHIDVPPLGLHAALILGSLLKWFPVLSARCVRGSLCCRRVLDTVAALSPHTNEPKPKAALSIAAIVSCVTMGAL